MSPFLHLDRSAETVYPFRARDDGLRTAAETVAMVYEIKAWCDWILMGHSMSRSMMLPAEVVVTQLVHPVLRLLESNPQGRWLTLTEAVSHRGKGSDRKYFEDPLKKYGNRSRLQVWCENGLAVRTDEGKGPWLINPLALVEEGSSVGAPRGSSPGRTQQDTDTDDGLADIEAAADELITQG